MPLPPFAAIYERAADRKGGAEALESLLPAEPAAGALAALPDDRVLAAMARAIFRSGFAWRVVEQKWPGIEDAFFGFDPGRVAGLEAEELGALLADARVIRNRGKILAIRDNAAWVCALAEAHGSAGRFLDAWPGGDVVGLWAVMAKDGSRLGGLSGPQVLREVGKDTFVLSESVVSALVLDGVVPKAPSGKGALNTVQQAFNAWRAESGRSLMAMSRILAYSVP